MAPADLPDLTDALAATLRGEPLLAGSLSALDPQLVVARAYRHGITGLIAERLHGEATASAALVSALASRSRQDLMNDLLCEYELRRMCDALSGGGVEALLMKGAHLAYSHYERSDLRPRVDTDVLIPVSGRPAAERALQQLGYEPVGQVSGELVTSQETYVLRRDEALRHVVDLHWRVANPQVFADMLGYDELFARSVLLPRLSPVARGLSNVDALLLACVHRVAHHYGSDRLIWLYDIHLLAGSLSRPEWQAFAALATDRRVAAICLASLRHTIERLHTDVPAEVVQSLNAALEAEEHSAAYLRPATPVASLVHDLRHLTTWRARLTLIREHVLPPTAYMRDVYGLNRNAPLPWLYVERLIVGARKWFARR